MLLDEFFPARILMDRWTYRPQLNLTTIRVLVGLHVVFLEKVECKSADEPVEATKLTDFLWL